MERLDFELCGFKTRRIIEDHLTGIERRKMKLLKRFWRWITGKPKVYVTIHPAEWFVTIHDGKFKDFQVCNIHGLATLVNEES